MIEHREQVRSFVTFFNSRVIGRLVDDPDLTNTKRRYIHFLTEYEPKVEVAGFSIQGVTMS